MSNFDVFLPRDGSVDEAGQKDGGDSSVSIPCEAGDCMDAAAGCATGCRNTGAACVDACSNNGCKNNCTNTQNNCVSNCRQTCNSCAKNTNCQSACQSAVGN